MRVWFSILLCLYFFSVKSQEKCGNAILNLQYENSPEYIEIKNEIQSHLLNYDNAKQTLELFTIPVVIHLDTSLPLISETQVQTQISVLNKAFRKTNSDTSITPNEFKPFMADCFIEFELAKQDPYGNCTNGIIQDSDTVWDRNNYLNIHVTELNGILGQSPLPGGVSASEDIVKIDYKYFGTTGTATSPYNKGKTAVHEVGHWLNLLHIWGDGGCSVDDNVSDTPQQGLSYSGVPFHPQTSCGSNDMFMNYMDYTYDAVLVMFTEGQKTRMRSVLDGGFRNSLKTSPALTPVIFGDLNNNCLFDAGEIAGDINLDGSISGTEISGDIDGDGIIEEDEIAGDINGNGTINSNEISGDINGNGNIDSQEITGDTNGDSLITDNEIAGDITGNNSIDFGEIAGDINGDKAINNNEISGDTNGNKIIDNNELEGDANGDGTLDASETVFTRITRLNEIKIFPNPTSGVIAIKGDYKSVEIKDISGKLVNHSIKNNKIQLQAEGVYFITIISLENQKFTEKVIVVQ